MKRTNAQIKAIESENNVIVSAGAGSGKTSVLTERIFNKIKKGVKIDELLILTFAKDAAEEMKIRVKQSLQNDKDTAKLAPLIDGANISTFDAYFLNLVKKYAHILGIPSNIENIPDDIITIKKYEILEDLLNKRYSSMDDKIIKILHNYCVKDDGILFNIIIKISNILSTFKNPEDYVKNYYNNYLSDDKINEFIHCYIDDYIIKTKEEIEHNLIKIGNEKVSNYFHNILLQFNSLKDLTDFNYDSISTFMTNPYKSEDAHYELFLESKELLQKMLLKKFKNFDFKNYFDIDVKNNQELIPYLLDIALELENKINEFKKEKNFYTFNDIAQMAKDLLENNEDIRLSIKNKLKIIMVDEYQDTSKFQEDFINLISNNNVFVVGDVKQSIYAFRDANPQQFADKYKKYHNPVFGTYVDMTTNFRSRREINDQINDIFSIIMDLNHGGADYKLEHIIETGNMDYDNLKTENPHGIFILNYDAKKPSLDEEINLIINDIKKRISNKMQVAFYNAKENKMCLRDIQYKDITLLLFKSTNFQEIEEKFITSGIPINAIYDEDLKTDDTIVVLINILKIINSLINNLKDEATIKHSFFSIARSFLYEYSDQKLYDLSLKNYKEDELYLKLINFSNSHKKSLINEIYMDCLTEFNFIDKLYLLGNGINKLKYLKIFYKRTEIMDNLNYSLFDFINYLEKLDELSIKMESKKSSDVDNAVTLTTIHKSKGLEYSIIYMPQIFSEGKNNSAIGKFFADKRFGFELPALYSNDNKGIHSCFYNDYADINFYDEKIRLLYVALTRAKEEVIIPLCSQNKQKIDNEFDISTIKLLEKSKSIGDLLFASKINFEESFYTTKEIKGINENEEETKVPKFEIKQFNYNFKKKTKHTASKELSLDFNIDNIRYGSHMHLLMESIDFYNKDVSNINNEKEKELIKKVLALPIFDDLNKTNIFKEYSFLDEENEIEGVIDLLIEHTNYIDIIDYKLSNISDKEYETQLNIYKQYIERVFKKETNIYLLSILNTELRKL